MRAAIEHRIKGGAWSLKGLAEESGIASTRISNYRHGRRHGGMSQYQLFSLCQFLKIDVSFNVSFV